VVLAADHERTARRDFDALTFVDDGWRSRRRWIPSQHRPIDGSREAGWRRLVHAIPAVSVARIHVLASERTDRRDLLVGRITRTRLRLEGISHVDAKHLPPNSHGVVGADDAAEEIIVLI